MRKLIRFGILLFVLISMGSMLTACKKEKAERSIFNEISVFDETSVLSDDFE